MADRRRENRSGANPSVHQPSEVIIIDGCRGVVEMETHLRLHDSDAKG